MNDKSLKELKKVMQIEGTDRKSGRIAREIALEQWIDEWIVEVNASQSIIKGSLSSEENDFIKYHMATMMGEELMNDCIDVKATPSSISTKIKALKR